MGVAYGFVDVGVIFDYERPFVIRARFYLERGAEAHEGGCDCCAGGFAFDEEA